MHHESELVGIIFDCSAVDWYSLEKRDVLPVSPVAAMEGVVIFLRTIIAGWTDKEFVLMAVSGKDSVVVFDGRPAAFDALDATVKVLNTVAASKEDSQMATAVSQFLLRKRRRRGMTQASTLGRTHLRRRGFLSLMYRLTRRTHSKRQCSTAPSPRRNQAPLSTCAASKCGLTR